MVEHILFNDWSENKPPDWLTRQSTVARRHQTQYWFVSKPYAFQLSDKKVCKFYKY